MNKTYMNIALEEAKKSIKTGDVPVGAVIVENNTIIAKSHNTRDKNHSIIGHAEINCVEKASKKLKTWHLNDCTMYVTLEPCPMCEEILKQCHIKEVIYATPSEKQINLKLNKRYEYFGDESSNLLKEFFENQRK